ncbi:MAG: cytochrome c maturation protein CcmE [Bacteroidota bacterium]
MKKIHIIGIILIASAIGIIISSLDGASTYADFRSAFARPGVEYHVIGELNREKEMVYQPEVDPNLFTFYMLDSLGIEKKVVLHQSKPQEFERSEKIVLIGKAQGEEFHASKILLKCPSKYNDGQVEMREEEMAEVPKI